MKPILLFSSHLLPWKKNGLYFLLMLVFLYGCDLPTDKHEGQTNLQHENYSDLVEQSLTYFDNLPYSQMPQVKRMEQLPNDLADIHEGFSGIWTDPEEQGHIIIALSKKHIDNNLNEELTTSIENRILNTITDEQAQNQIRFSYTDAEFTFRDLQHIRDLLNPVIHRRNDIVESFIDKKNNAYSIGILENANKNEYFKLLRTYSISTDAVKIYKTGPVVTAGTSSSTEIAQQKNIQSTQSSHTIRDRIRPIIGGIQIQSNHFKTCTLGFTAKLNGADVWVTTSTCSNHFSSSSIANTNTEFYNPTNNTIHNRIGFEERDFGGFDDGFGNKYRFSDAVLVFPDAFIDFAKRASTVTGSFPFDWPITGWGNSGPIDFIGAHTILGDDTDNDPIWSYALKIGRTTGTTGTSGASGSGGFPPQPIPTINYCVDVSSNDSSQLPSGWTLRCQIRTDIYTANGDWGAPLFSQRNSISAPDALIGITWGNNPSQQVSYHSPLSAIRDELTSGGETLEVK